ncbi:Hypothetical predicted protein [Cloeon dipterum]|uniref:Uncharacterized protein n=1 Tax=Cloeon dipterum TaxID=197152 RepID=A0A8S1CN31_9INSE|nr:Hypothetical predicted protein [Cloeon dipterum]
MEKRASRPAEFPAERFDVYEENTAERAVRRLQKTANNPRGDRKGGKAGRSEGAVCVQCWCRVHDSPTPLRPQTQVAAVASHVSLVNTTVRVC